MSEAGNLSDPSLASLKDLVEQIARALVDDPDSVEVSQIAGTATVIYEISVAPGDAGKIVGRQGHNISALRTLVAAVGAKLGRRPQVVLIEPR